MNAYEIINTYIIDKFCRKNGEYVGTEVELPLINLNKDPVSREFAIKLTKFLQDELGFMTNAITNDGIVCVSENQNHDTFSFETSINTIEFSMCRAHNICDIADRFYGYLTSLAPFLEENNYQICGNGTNPYAKYADSSPIKTASNLAKYDFLKEFTNHKNGEIFHSFCASTQTHIDVDRETLITKLNLFNRLNFVNAFLFSNSPPTFELPVEVDYNTICFRDMLWELCGAPNTGLCDKTFVDIDDLCQYFTELKIFVLPNKEGVPVAINPISIGELFLQKDTDLSAITFFRSIQNVTPNKFGALEIRSDCTGPIDQIFAPVAFNLGIEENFKSADKILCDFLVNNNISLSNSQRRRAIITGKSFVDEQILRELLLDLVILAEEGLKNRGFGEEKFIQHLFDRAKTGYAPTYEENVLIKY